MQLLRHPFFWSLLLMMCHNMCTAGSPTALPSAATALQVLLLCRSPGHRGPQASQPTALIPAGASCRDCSPGLRGPAGALRWTQSAKSLFFCVPQRSGLAFVTVFHWLLNGWWQALSAVLFVTVTLLDVLKSLLHKWLFLPQIKMCQNRLVKSLRF